MNIENIIVTPYQSKVKYYYIDKKIYYSKLIYDLTIPYNSGVFEETLSISNKPLKNLVLLRTPLQTGTYIKINIIGGLTYTSKNGIHYRMISVPYNCKEITDIRYVKSIYLDEIKLFISSYNSIKDCKIRMGDFINKEKSIKTYKESKIRYLKTKNINSIIHTDDIDDIDDTDNTEGISRSPSVKERLTDFFFKK